MIFIASFKSINPAYEGTFYSLMGHMSSSNAAYNDINLQSTERQSAVLQLGIAVRTSASLFQIPTTLCELGLDT